MKNKRGRLSIVLGLLLLAAALILTGYNIYQSYQGGKASREITDKMKEEIDDEEEEDSDDDVTEQPIYQRFPELQMPKFPLDGYNYIGILTISDLGLELPIMDQWSYEGLRVSPGRYMGSVYTKNMIIAGHNYDTHFGRLRNLSTGARISFTDAEGNVFNYEVMGMEVIPETHVTDMEAGDWDLTIFTCDLGGYNRVTVRCRQITKI